MIRYDTMGNPLYSLEQNENILIFTFFTYVNGLSSDFAREVLSHLQKNTSLQKGYYLIIDVSAMESENKVLTKIDENKSSPLFHDLLVQFPRLGTALVTERKGIVYRYLHSFTMANHQHSTNGHEVRHFKSAKEAFIFYRNEYKTLTP